jgi:glutamine amidotransferase
MCELFAISSSLPTSVSFSMTEFSQHGGLTGRHKDGWGIAFYEDNDVQIVRETIPASRSDYIHCLQDYNFISRLVLSHIRLATHGQVRLKNTQPFSRELGGRMHVFAHNGDLGDIRHSQPLHLGRYHPVGDTDSEYAFCVLMGLLANVWDGDGLPSLGARLSVVADFAAQARILGSANFIYSDSDILLIHGHYGTRQEDQGLHKPGLFTCCRTCAPEPEQLTIQGVNLDLTMQQHVLLVASVPLTTEVWTPLASGEIQAIAQGRVLQKITLG